MSENVTTSETATCSASWARRLHRKAPGWIAVLALIAVTAIITAPLIAPKIAVWNERRHSFNSLAAANNREDLQEAVGYLGVVLDLADGEWISIRYRDSHGWPGYSISVALTSDGRWLESTHHFCGLFNAYEHYADTMAEVATEELRQIYLETVLEHEELRRLHRIDTVCTLDEAVAELQAMSFVPSTVARPANSVDANQ